MATQGRNARRGLPRVAGEDSWPPVGAPRIDNEEKGFDEAPKTGRLSQTSVTEPSTEPRRQRRGLPRLAAGEQAHAEPEPEPEPEPEAERSESPAAAAAGRGRPQRRGLPRGAADGLASSRAESTSTPSDAATAATTEGASSAPPATVAARSVAAEALPFTRTVWPGRAAARVEPAPEPRRIGRFTRRQWVGLAVVGGGGLLFAMGLAVSLVRWLLSTPWGADFLAAFPGEYHLPADAPVGFPAWLAWQHAFNVFLMILIIRSGLQVRRQKKPPATWSPRWNRSRKISLTLWFHQSLDILWILNGAAFVVLLFVTGQWMRIVPTSWEVFPNALSSALQYVSLDWPTENGWVNYNALQQIAYFVTVFVAAPLAAITGVRMSGLWPKNAEVLNRVYPVEWARAVHFPVMVYFLVFIFFHVVLVFATGALRNLNHMYAAQGSADGDAYADNWVGFWLFAASMLVIAAAWAAARPMILAPIARLFGEVSRS